MAENFDLIFGQNASQQYAWSDSDYQNGWETVGNIPPTAAQFDALQRRTDTKAQELNTRLTTVESAISGGGATKRQANTEYTVGTILTLADLPMDWVIECIVGGITGSSDITAPAPLVEGARILDGTVTWALRKIATYGGIGYRQSSTACPTGSIAFSAALPVGWYLEATTGGITSASDLVITSPAIGDTVTDGTVTWTIRAVASTADIPAPVDISGKANVDLDNLTAAGEAKIANIPLTSDFTIIYPNGGSEASPANVSKNSRYVESNPYPGYYVKCIAEVNYNNKWADTEWLTAGGSSTVAYGVKADQLNDTDIVIQTGETGTMIDSNVTGSAFGYSGSNITSPIPCRVKVWKIGKIPTA